MNPNDVGRLVTIVIRSCGERTEQLCYELLRHQVNDENIHRIHGIPFVDTLRRAFSLALEECRKWTLCIDADVLVRPGFVMEILQYAESVENDVCEVKGITFDKFFTSPREVGQRLYRTENLGLALEYIDEEAACSVRPESHIVARLWKQGLKTAVSDIFVGVHDVEQSYRDIYRKCFTHTLKNRWFVNIEAVVENLWKSNMTHDPDFLVAYQGFIDAQHYTGDLRINRHADFMESFSERLDSLGLEEKRELTNTFGNAVEFYNNAFITALKICCWGEKRKLENGPDLETLKRFNRFIKFYSRAKIAIWGGGIIFENFLKYFIPEEIDICVVDNYKNGTTVGGRTVHSPDILESFAPNFVIVTPERYLYEIKRNVRKLCSHPVSVFPLSFFKEQISEEFKLLDSPRQIKIDKKKAREVFEKAEVAFAGGSLQEALILFCNAITENPALKDEALHKVGLINQQMMQMDQSNKRIRLNPRVVVYTCNFGGYESVKEPLCVDDSVEYILFTDDPNLESRHWETVVVKDLLPDPRRTSRLPKILAHKYLPPHEISVYIDSSIELKESDVRTMIEKCMEGKDIALYRHFMRDCVYDEIDFVVNHSDRHLSDPVLAQRAVEMYQAIDYPRNNGLFENAFIFRKNTAQIQSLNELWWDLYQHGSERDQFVLMYCLYLKNIEVNPIKVGKQFRENPFVNFYYHRYSPSGDDTLNNH